MRLPRNHVLAVILGAALLVGAAHCARAEQPAAQKAQPVTVSVVDSRTGKAIAEFSYTYSVDVPGGKGASVDDWQTVRSAGGAFTLEAPASCQVTICTKARGYLSGYGQICHSFELKADDPQPRRLVVRMDPGMTVRGTVRDATTRAPVAGASVAPRVFTPPLWTADRERAVTTDKEGRFELRGVEAFLGIAVTHPDYFEQDVEQLGGGKSAEASVEVLLRSGEALRGRVQDPAGKPLQGVEVSDGAGKGTRTDKDGRFVLKSIRPWWGGSAYYLDFEKEGYVDQTLHPKTIPAEEMAVVLEPLLRLAGQVLSPEGQPVRQFTVMAGPGRNPPDFQCADAKVDEPQGRWELRLAERGTHWVGVRAEGFAAWEGWTDVGAAGQPLVVRLQSGVSVSGKVRGPEGGVADAQLALAPQRPEGDEMIVSGTPARDLATVTAVTRADGSFELAHVRPDRYLLSVAAKRITPIHLALVVPETGLDAGVLAARGTGRIVGQVFRPGDEQRRPWAFAGGHVTCPSPAAHYGQQPSISFTADENGRFTVEDVPAGRVTVGFNYQILVDVIGEYGRAAAIEEGRTTEVRFFDPKHTWDLPLEIVVGDGSPCQFGTGTGMAAKRKAENVTWRNPEFHIDLEPEPGHAVSVPSPDWHQIEGAANSRIVLPDVHPGKYRLRLNDFQGSIGLVSPLYEAAVEARPGQPVRVPLGASSITGRARWPKETRRLVMAAAVDETGKSPPRYAYCDDEGNFCLRYLGPGRYTIYLHDDDAGWSRLEHVELATAATLDVEPPALAPGGTITGHVRWTSERRIPNRLVAVDPSGIVVEPRELFRGLNGEEYAVSGLWPGRWKVTVSCGDEVLAAAQATLVGTERVSCDLLGK